MIIFPSFGLGGENLRGGRALLFGWGLWGSAGSLNGVAKDW